VPVPLVGLGPAVPVPLPAAVPTPVPSVLNMTTGLAASGVPYPVVDAPEQADKAPSESAKQETPIESAALFFIVPPDATGG
jgi:hypothetical protein